MSFQRYAQQLVDRNYRVIRIEQTETPEQMRERTGKSSGTLMREACQFLSAGTNFSPDDEMLKDHSPKCLVTLVEQCGADGALSYGVCVLDPSTSCFEVGSFVEDMCACALFSDFNLPGGCQITLAFGWFVWAGR